MTRHRLWVSNITPALLRRLGVTPTQFESNDAGAGNLLDRAQQWDLETLLAEGLLTKADRASMSSALELRAPFLDQAVMEFAKSLRVEDRLRGFKTKVFLKRYARRYLPKNIVNRRKRGLSVPISSWSRGPLKEWANSTLRKGHLEQVGIRTSAAMELLSEHCRREADHDVSGVVKSVLLAGLTAISGFGSLALARNPALTGLGVSCAIGIFWSLVATIFFTLPAMAAAKPKA